MTGGYWGNRKKRRLRDACVGSMSNSHWHDPGHLAMLSVRIPRLIVGPHLAEDRILAVSVLDRVKRWPDSALVAVAREQAIHN